jgi:hypothetical protein
MVGATRFCFWPAYLIGSLENPSTNEHPEFSEFVIHAHAFKIINDVPI